MDEVTPIVPSTSGISPLTPIIPSTSGVSPPSGDKLTRLIAQTKEADKENEKFSEEIKAAQREIEELKKKKQLKAKKKLKVQNKKQLESLQAEIAQLKAEAEAEAESESSSDESA